MRWLLLYCGYEGDIGGVGRVDGFVCRNVKERALYILNHCRRQSSFHPLIMQAWQGGAMDREA